MKKVLIFVLSLVFTFTLCACSGNAQQPSTEPETEAATNPPRCIHQFEMSITAEPTCENVGEATYTCSLCNLDYTEELEMTDHIIEEADCTTASTCTFCGKYFGEALGHNFADATCSQPETCINCGETRGEASNHDFMEADCTTGETCQNCGQIIGEALGHDYEDGICARCGAEEPTN